MNKQLRKDLLHVYDQWQDPQLSTDKLQELVDRGWLWHHTGVEVPYWEVTFRGWRALEQAKLVAKPYK